MNSFEQPHNSPEPTPSFEKFLRKGLGALAVAGTMTTGALAQQDNQTQLPTSQIEYTGDRSYEYNRKQIELYRNQALELYQEIDSLYMQRQEQLKKRKRSPDTEFVFSLPPDQGKRNVLVRIQNFHVVSIITEEEIRNDDQTTTMKSTIDYDHDGYPDRAIMNKNPSLEGHFKRMENFQLLLTSKNFDETRKRYIVHNPDNTFHYVPQPYVRREYTYEPGKEVFSEVNYAQQNEGLDLYGREARGPNATDPLMKEITQFATACTDLREKLQQELQKNTSPETDVLIQASTASR